MKINKVWSMPNKKTFNIKPIRELIYRYLPDKDSMKFDKDFHRIDKECVWIDPFAGESNLAHIRNDLEITMETQYHQEALAFLKSLESNKYDGCLFDPPYSLRQLVECYKKNNLSVNMQTTQSSYWSKIKKEIARIVKPNGYVISFGWNSNGIGKHLQFKQIEILLVAHGGSHNDTICVVEKKLVKGILL